MVHGHCELWLLTITPYHHCNCTSQLAGAGACSSTPVGPWPRRHPLAVFPGCLQAERCLGGAWNVIFTLAMPPEHGYGLRVQRVLLVPNEEATFPSGSEHEVRGIVASKILGEQW